MMYEALTNISLQNGDSYLKGELVSEEALGDKEVIESLVSRGWIKRVKRKQTQTSETIVSEENNNG